MADIFFGKFSKLISTEENSGNKDKDSIKETIEDKNQTKQKTQNHKVIIYAGGIVAAAVLIYLFL